MPLSNARAEHHLLTSGLLLFLLGLLQGVVVHLFASPRLGLSAHIAAVQNGMVLVVLALVWPRVRLAARWGRVAVASVIGGMYAIWMSFSIAALAGAASVFRFAGQGRIDSFVLDLLVSGLVYAGAGASMVGVALFLAGALRRES